jgi:hypothetical protein
MELGGQRNVLVGTGPSRHCEEHSDEAIQPFFAAVDCFAALAMTIGSLFAAE